MTTTASKGFVREPERFQFRKLVIYCSYQSRNYFIFYNRLRHRQTFHLVFVVVDVPIYDLY